MMRQPDFFRQMNEQLVEQLEEYARQPGRTGNDVLDWLTERQVKTSRSAVYSWLQDFRVEWRHRRATDAARQYLDAARSSDPTIVTEAALKKFEELVLEYMMSAEESDAKDLMFIASAMKTGLGSRKDIIELKRKGREQMEQLASTAKQKQITPEMIEQVSKAVFG